MADHVAFVIYRNLNGLAFKVRCSAPDAIGILSQSLNIREPVRSRTISCLAFSEAVGTLEWRTGVDLPPIEGACAAIGHKVCLIELSLFVSLIRDAKGRVIAGALVHTDKAIPVFISG